MFKRFHLSSLLFASFVGTLFMTIFLRFFSVDFIKLLGSAVAFGSPLFFPVGFVAHFGIGLVYSLFYALFFEPFFHRFSSLFCGLLFSLVPFSFFYLYGETCLQRIDTMKPYQEERELTKSKPKGDEYYDHLQKKRQKMGKEIVMERVESAAEHSILSLGAALASHLIFGISLSLIYRPREPKIWYS